MKGKAIAALATIAVQAAMSAPQKGHQNDLDELSLEELLELRESILEVKQNLTYYIEESDDEDDDFTNGEESDNDDDDEDDDEEENELDE